jgi:hypothetical protein
MRFRTWLRQPTIARGLAALMSNQGLAMRTIRCQMIVPPTSATA